MKRLDMFSPPVQLSLRGKYSINTTFGGYLSVITFLCMALYVWFTGNDIIYKKNPKTYQENIIKKRSNNFTLSKNHTPFYFQLLNADDKSPFIDPTVLKLKLVLKSYTNSKIINVTEYMLETCTEEHFKHISSDEYEDNVNFYKLLLQRGYFCPEISSGINIYGSWVEQNLTLLQVLVYPCNNITDGVACKTREQISETIWNKRIYLSFMYPLLSVGLTNYISPFSFNFKEDYYYLPKIDAYEFYIYEVEEYYVMTDYGFLLSEYKEEKAQNFYIKSNSRRNYKVADPYFFSIDIQSSFNQVYYTRVYITISDILSNVGGMYSNIGPLVIIWAGLFIQLERTQIMLKNFFVYKEAFEQADKYTASKNSSQFNEFLSDYKNKSSWISPKNKKTKDNYKLKCLKGANVSPEEYQKQKESSKLGLNTNELYENRKAKNKIQNKTLQENTLLENSKRSFIKLINSNSHTNSIIQSNKNSKDNNNSNFVTKNPFNNNETIEYLGHNLDPKAHLSRQINKDNINKEQILNKNNSFNNSYRKVHNHSIMNDITENNLLESMNKINNNNNIDSEAIDKHTHNTHNGLNNLAELSAKPSKSVHYSNNADVSIIKKEGKKAIEKHINIRKQPIKYIDNSDNKCQLDIGQNAISARRHNSEQAMEMQQVEYKESYYKKNNHLTNNIHYNPNKNKNISEFDDNKQVINYVNTHNYKDKPEKSNIKTFTANINNPEPDKAEAKNHHPKMNEIFRIFKKLSIRLKGDELKLNLCEKFKITFSEIFCLRSKPNTKLYRLYILMQHCNNRIENYFDFINLIESLEETKILKEMFLANHQALLLDVLKKQPVSIDLAKVEQKKLLNHNSQDNIKENKKSTNKYEYNSLISAIDMLYTSAQAKNKAGKRNHIFNPDKNFLIYLNNLEE